MADLNAAESQTPFIWANYSPPPVQPSPLPSGLSAGAHIATVLGLSDSTSLILCSSGWISWIWRCFGLAIVIGITYMGS